MFRPRGPPPHHLPPRSSISSDVSSIASKSTSTGATSISSYDLHPAFRRHVFPHLPLSSMYEDTELVWATPPPTQAKGPSSFLQQHRDSTGSSFFFDEAPASRPATPPYHASSLKTPVRDISRLPVFAISPPDKIFIEPADLQREAAVAAPFSPAVDLVRTAMLASKDRAENHSTTVYAVDISPASYIIASKHGDKTIRIHSVVNGPHQNQYPAGGGTGISLQATLKTSFYVQMQPRSRDFFITSHAILSETRSLLAIASGFGHTLEIWDWARRKKLQVISDAAYRWASPKGVDIYDTSCSCPLVCYHGGSGQEGNDDTISVYPVAPPSLHGSPTAKNPPFGAPTVINLANAGLPHIPKFPELAISSTTNPPLLVAAAGPRPPRPGHPPPTHAAMLMAWTLPTANDAGSGGTSAAAPHLWRVALPTQHAQLATSLPCGLATHGNIAVSIWIPHGVRVIGRPGAWQVEPVAAIHERYVLVWRLEEGTTSVFAIPNQNTLACVSPDCRFVAYRQGPGADTLATAGGGGGGREVCLVVLDAMRGGREVWRTPGRGGGGCRLEGRDCGQLMDLSRVSALAFSGDGQKLLIGDTGGSVGVYEVRTTAHGDFTLGVV
ncbi:hypothetical protein N0V82_005129 [Gnomoniopsis sp. IMI 355080]|nr:hypothetical protein N0V82_005129 [Gnomoniopsis sp. IMI 355080]